MAIIQREYNAFPWQVNTHTLYVQSWDRRIQHRKWRETNQQPSSLPGLLCFAVTYFPSLSGIKPSGPTLYEHNELSVITTTLLSYYSNKLRNQSGLEDF